jgi:N-acetylglutamate synthase
MAIRYRPMTLRDYSAAVELWNQSEGVAVDVGDEHAGIARFLRRNRQLSFVAYDGRQLVGAVLAGHDGRRGYLYHLAVARSHRGRGIATQIERRSRAALRRAGLPRTVILVIRSNRGGQRFWRQRRWEGLPDVLPMIRDL